MMVLGKKTSVPLLKADSELTQVVESIWKSEQEKELG